MILASYTSFEGDVSKQPPKLVRTIATVTDIAIELEMLDAAADKAVIHEIIAGGLQFCYDDIKSTLDDCVGKAAADDDASPLIDLYCTSR